MTEKTCKEGHERCFKSEYVADGMSTSRERFCPEHKLAGPHCIQGHPIGEECVKADVPPPPPEGKPPGPPTPPRCPCGAVSRPGSCKKCDAVKAKPQPVEALSEDYPTCACEQYYGKHHPECPVVATICARNDELLELDRNYDALNVKFLKAESERDALADQLATVVDAVIRQHPGPISGTTCEICGWFQAGVKLEGYGHAKTCPLSNLPAAVQARRDQFEKVKAALTVIRDKAGSHTVSGHVDPGDQNDPGYSGIYAVAESALKETPDDK